MIKNDVVALTSYLRKRFNAPSLRVQPHPKKKDMAEVFIGDEFIAPLYREEEDGEVSYQMQLVILDVDLEEGAAD
ncbi:MAG: DUF3126 family protein [Hyphomicrobiaceae bacterium]